MSDSLIALIDAELPQTQCGLCGHPAGCLPYARAMVHEQQAANLCVPGGQPVADRLANLLERQRLLVAPSDWPIAEDGRPQRMIARIRAEDCIGCTKCLVACPVDAIVGANKLMHQIIEADCTGCELCIPPCPVDCIDLIESTTPRSPAAQIALQTRLRTRYQRHVARLQKRADERQARRNPVLSALAAQRMAQLATQPAHTPAQTIATTATATPKVNAQQTIALASIRSQLGKLKRQLAREYREDVAAQIATLEQQLKDAET